MEDIDRTFNILRGISREELENIIAKVHYDCAFDPAIDSRVIIDEQLALYGWTYARYVEYFF